MPRPVAGAAALVAASLLLSACESTGGTATLETEDQKASYAAGLDIGRSLGPAGERLDQDALLRGIGDAVAGRDPALPQEELTQALRAFMQSVQQAQREEQQRRAEENQAAGEAFLAENAEREGVTTTESGLQYEVLEEGSGPTPGPEDAVRVHYQGTLPDGTEFDSSAGGDPAEFRLAQVIPGFREALQLMPVGSRYRVVIPGSLAYGPQGRGATIGPNQTLVFELELVEIVE